MKQAILEGLQNQGKDEEQAYSIDTTDYGGSPALVSCAVFCLDTNDDVTSVTMPTNSPSVTGDDIGLSVLKSLTPGKTYRVEVLFTSTGQICEVYFRVSCPF